MHEAPGSIQLDPAIVDASQDLLDRYVAITPTLDAVLGRTDTSFASHPDHPYAARIGHYSFGFRVNGTGEPFVVGSHVQSSPAFIGTKRHNDLIEQISDNTTVPFAETYDGLLRDTADLQTQLFGVMLDWVDEHDETDAGVLRDSLIGNDTDPNDQSPGLVLPLRLSAYRALGGPRPDDEHLLVPFPVSHSNVLQIIPATRGIEIDIHGESGSTQHQPDEDSGLVLLGRQYSDLTGDPDSEHVHAARSIEPPSTGEKIGGSVALYVQMRVDMPHVDGVPPVDDPRYDSAYEPEHAIAYGPDTPPPA